MNKCSNKSRFNVKQNRYERPLIFTKDWYTQTQIANYRQIGYSLLSAHIGLTGSVSTQMNCPTNGRFTLRSKISICYICNVVFVETINRGDLPPSDYSHDDQLYVSKQTLQKHQHTNKQERCLIKGLHINMYGTYISIDNRTTGNSAHMQTLVRQKQKTNVYQYSFIMCWKNKGHIWEKKLSRWICPVMRADNYPKFSGSDRW